MRQLLFRRPQSAMPPVTPRLHHPCGNTAPLQLRWCSTTQQASSLLSSIATTAAIRDVSIEAAKCVLLESILDGPKSSRGNVLPASSPSSTPTNHVSMLVVVEGRPCALGLALEEGYLSSDLNTPTDANTIIASKRLVFNPDTFIDDVDVWLQQHKEGGGNTTATPQPVVVLIQTGAFQNELKKYRLRLELFKKGCRVAEHCHLGLMCRKGDGIGGSESTSAADQIETYLSACTYSPHDAVADGTSLADKLNGCIVPLASDTSAQPSGTSTIVAYDIVIQSKGGHELVYSSGVEPCVLNTGSYSHQAKLQQQQQQAAAAVSNSGSTKPSSSATMTSIGGTYPVGEVITESVDLGELNGTASFFGYPTLSKTVGVVPDGDEFILEIEKGCIVSSSSSTSSPSSSGCRIPSEMKELMAIIRQAETVPEVGSTVTKRDWSASPTTPPPSSSSSSIHVKPIAIRELGIGLNPHVGRNRQLSDVTSFERQHGVHLSIGMRHPLFPKRPRADVSITTSTTTSVTTTTTPQVGPVLRRKDGMFHIDIFIAAERIFRRPKPAVVDAVHRGVISLPGQCLPLQEEVIWTA